MKKCALIRARGILLKNVGLGLTASLAMGVAASAAVYTDNFDSYAAGSNLSGQGGWTDTGGGTAYKTVSGGGAGGTQGITTGAGSTQINWTGYLWNWGTSVAVGESVVVGMDFQANGSGQFDDDRVGWVLASNATSSSYHFGVQLDNSAGGLETYFRDTSGNRVLQTTVMNWTALGIPTGSNWYREQLTVKKLTSGLGAGGAEVSVSFWALDGSGNPIGSPLTASYGNIDTSTLRGFSGDVYPMFKNYSAQPGNADNAYFAIIPEPGSWSLFAVGVLALGARRRRA